MTKRPFRTSQEAMLPVWEEEADKVPLIDCPQFPAHPQDPGQVKALHSAEWGQDDEPLEGRMALRDNGAAEAAFHGEPKRCFPEMLLLQVYLETGKSMWSSQLC